MCIWSGIYLGSGIYQMGVLASFESNQIDMRLFIAILVIFVSVVFISGQRKKSKPRTMKLFEVTGLITETQSYCGGAAPPQDLLDELSKPKPIKGYSMYIRKTSNDFKNPILHKIFTDSNGMFKIKLPIGSYSVVDGSKKDSQTYNDYLTKYKHASESFGPLDETCYLKYFSTPDFVIKVEKSKKTISLAHNYHRSCSWSRNPCMEFRGQYPP